ncbi:hypothetical protein [Roseateles sp.]|uniref:hypothetical protein n=1 Tax=Roseateles sp. TaxID=1971397 RepID=UPI0039E797E2
MRVAALLLSCAIALAAGRAQAVEIRLGSLSLDWPAGYAVKSARPPFELSGPGGAKVLVTVMRPGASANNGQEARAKLEESVEGMVTAQAQKAGKVVLPLGRQVLPDGTQLRFIGSEVNRLMRGTGYLLQYVLLAPSGQIGLLTFEGRGEVLREHEAVRALFQTVQWSVGEGSMAERAAFTEKVAGLLRARLTDSEVVVAEPLTLKVGELQANLDRVFGFCRANVQSCDGELQRYVQAVVDVHTKAGMPATKDALRLTVRAADFGSTGLPPAAAKAVTLHRPFVAGLVAVPMLDSVRSARLVTEGDCDALHLSPDQTHELALANVRAILKPLAEVAQPVKPGAIGTIGGDFYESSRVLSPNDWAPLAQAQGGVLIVALPAKDAVLYSADDSPAGIDALRTYARDVARRSPGRLTDVLLRWTPTGWQAVP